MFRRSIVGLSVEDVEKRRIPSKHYVYVIYVTWNDGSLNVIYRRYSRFFELQTRLLDKFPEEAGTKDPTRRIIPFLPGKILFGRSHIREVALKRLDSINQYCKALVKLPAHISECDEILAFFETAPDDLLQHSKTIEKKPSERKAKQISHPLLLDQYVAIAEYEKKGRNEVNLQTGQRVEVVEKTEIGWWFVSTDEGQGWVPSSHLEKEDGSQEDRVVHEASPGEEERFVVMETYIPMAADEIRIDKGGFVQVVERNLDGWWLVRYQGNEGRVPATNLTKADTLKMTRVTRHVTAPPVEVIPNLMSISTFNRQKLDRLVSASSNENGGDKAVANQETPSKPLIDLSFDGQPSGAQREESGDSRHGIDENFNPLLRNSRRKCPPPRRNSVSTVGPPRPAPPAMEAVYVAVADLSVTVEDGVSLHRGQVVSVLEKTETGWWYVSAGGERGWAPVSYINKRQQPKKILSSTTRPQRPEPPSAKPALRPGPISEESPSSGLSSLAAVLQAGHSKQQQQQSAVSCSEPLRPETTAPSVSEQLYQNVEVGDGPGETGDQLGEAGRYTAAFPFEGMEVGEVRLSAGDLVDVLGKNASGWWYVRVLEGSGGQGEGWVPSSFLQPADEDDVSVGSGFSSLGGGVYTEVRNSLYDDIDSAWSDSSGSQAASVSASPAHAPSGMQADIEHISGEQEDSNLLQHKSESAQSPGLPQNTPRQDSEEKDFSEIERLNNYFRSSFHSQRPVLPLKKSKDVENSQQKMALESKPNIPFLKPMNKNIEMCSNREEVSSKPACPSKPASVKPSTSSLKPVSQVTSNRFKPTTKTSAEEKPSPPVKTFANGRLKPAVPESKPGLATKPSVPSNKPVAFTAKPGVKPPVPGTKPKVQGKKPCVPLKKPEESRIIPKYGVNKKEVNTVTHTQPRPQFPAKPGAKLAWPPTQPSEITESSLRHRDVTDHRKTSSPTRTSSSPPNSSKVKDLAKVFGQ